VQLLVKEMCELMLKLDVSFLVLIMKNIISYSYGQKEKKLCQILGSAEYMLSQPSTITILWYANYHATCYLEDPHDISNKMFPEEWFDLIFDGSCR